MPDYIPPNEGDLVTWFKDHATGVNTHGATVGLSAGEITQAQTDSDVVDHAVLGRSLYNSKSQEFTAYKDILLYAPRARETWKHDLCSRLAELTPDVRVREWPIAGDDASNNNARDNELRDIDTRDIEIAIMGPAPPAELWDSLPGLRWVMGLVGSRCQH